MLTTHPSSAQALSDAAWIDLLNPTEEERERAAQASGLRMPSRAALEEIESSSRAFIEDEALYLSTPVLEGPDCRGDTLTTVGFVLTPKRLVTLRFSRVAAFEAIAASPSVDQLSPVDVFLKLIEAIVDHAADALEHASADLESISTAAFHAEHPRGERLNRASEALYAALRRLGRMEDRVSRVRDTLLGIGRIVGFLCDAEGEHRLPTSSARIEAIRRDVISLSDYHTHLSGKIQFLLDATLGFINIQQNDIVKALTIVSVVGVPPVLIVGIYGMNFKHMPELDWTLGYPFSLVLIAVSALLPLAWFKWRGWM
jgi:magnesium transporter